MKHTNGLQFGALPLQISSHGRKTGTNPQGEERCGKRTGLMECTPHHNTTDLPASIGPAYRVTRLGLPLRKRRSTHSPGRQQFLHGRNLLPELAFPLSASAWWTGPTGKPVFLDISDLPMKKGIVTNRNKFILGPSGSGKSFLPTIS